MKSEKRFLDKMDSHLFVIDNLCKLFQTLDKECNKFESTRVNIRSYHYWFTLTHPSGISRGNLGKIFEIYWEKFPGISWNFSETSAPWG